MRTVDPALWARGWTKEPIKVTRPFRFGQRAAAGFEAQLRRSIQRTLEEFLKKCSIRGFSRATNRSLPTVERLVYRGCLLALLCGGCALIARQALFDSWRSPVMEVLTSSEHHISRVPFPAIALCSYNLISKSAAMNYSKFLSSQDRKLHALNVSSIYDNLLVYGALVDMNAPLVDADFVSALRQLDPARGSNVTQLIQLLAEPCAERMVLCRWRGRAVPCADLFALRLTQLGFCCVFNARYLPEDADTAPQFELLPGYRNGLTVTVGQDPGDFAYLRRPLAGIEVLVFDGSEYPLLEGGATSSFAAPLHASTYLPLEATEYTSSALADEYSEERRGCRSSSGRSESYVSCLTACKRATWLSLCSCVPYSLLPGQDYVCTPLQLNCLNKFREKMLFFYPGAAQSDAGDAALQQERADSLECAHCRPGCRRYKYSASPHTVRYMNNEKVFLPQWAKGLRIGNMTVIGVYFSSENQVLYTMVAVSPWPEALVNSGIYVILGVAVMFLPEFLFFWTIRWSHHFRTIRSNQQRH